MVLAEQLQRLICRRLTFGEECVQALLSGCHACQFVGGMSKCPSYLQAALGTFAMATSGRAPEASSMAAITSLVAV